MTDSTTASEWTTGAHAAFPFTNFEPIPGGLRYGAGDLTFQTLEHAFQAMKTTDPAERERVRDAATPAQAKRLGRKVTLRPDWERIKGPIMKTLLRAKFAREPFRSRLLGWDQPLVEYTTWHDTYWGVCTCARHGGRGENHLGRLLAEVRSELLAEATTA
jgi:ribA/ribD-fused uncharacterized protein